MRSVSQYLFLHWESVRANNARNQWDIQLRVNHSKEDWGTAAVVGGGLMVLLAKAATPSMENDRC